MINTPALRKQFKAIRQEQNKNGIIGQLVIGGLLLCSCVGMTALIIRLACVGIVLIHNLLTKGF